MKTYLKLFVILAISGLTAIITHDALARRSTNEFAGKRMEAPERNSERMIERLTTVLAETDHPLTEEQTTALQEIDFAPGSRGAVRDILTEEQQAIMAESMRRGRHGRSGGGHIGFRPEGMNRESHIERMGQVLEEAGVALTDKQKEQLEALEPREGMRGEIAAILTDEQKEALHSARPERPEGNRVPDGRMRGGRGGILFGKVLEEAGCPLSDWQKDQFSALEPGEGMREQIEAILTDEQKEALKAARENVPGRQRSPELLFEVLEDAGKSLTDAQKTAINDLEPGKGHRVKLMEILNDEQKEALRTAAKEHRGRGRHRNRNSESNSPDFESAEEHEIENTETTSTLYNNYPNPFNPTTTIRFDTLEPSNVTLEVYNIEGQRVRTLVNHYVSAGTHSVVWNGTNDLGQQVSAGHYFYILKTKDNIETQKMVFMK